MKKLTKKAKENIIKNIPNSDHDGVLKEDLRDKLNQVIDGMHMGFERMDRQFASIDQHFDRLENRMGSMEIELSQVKDVVLDIQQEKASRTDVLAIEKRVTKLEMNNARAARK